MNIDIRGHLDVPFFVGLHFHLLLPHSSPQNVRSSRHRAQVTFIGRPMFSTMDISRVLLLYAPLPSTDFQCLARGRLVCPGLSRGHLSFRKSVDIWNAALEAVGHYFTKYKRLRPRLQTLVKGKRLRVFVLHIILDTWLYLIRTDACRRRTPTASFLVFSLKNSLAENSPSCENRGNYLPVRKPTRRFLILFLILLFYSLFYTYSWSSSY